MTQSRNANVVELLSWHGHDRGGVRVPFGEFGEPLGEVIETPLLEKLREVAAAIASGSQAPRWFLLVGGPGNGKSQMVEEFVRAIGENLGCEHDLVTTVKQEFERIPTPRKVEVTSATISGDARSAFDERVRRLIIIQDASASDVADMDAADQLADDLLSLLTEPVPDGTPLPILVCCVNRGVLARTLSAAESAGEVVVDLLEGVIRASGLGAESLQEDPPSCWPVTAAKFEAELPDLAGIVACWPMDVESLLAGYDHDTSTPPSIILEHATDVERWEASGCHNCDSRHVCPFLQNARWLRKPSHRQALLRLLRRQELASGQHWNFRSLFSLIAELLVGEWVDFGSDKVVGGHPCEWVHSSVAQLESSDRMMAVQAAFSLVRRLYPHALFAMQLLPVPGEVREATASMPLGEAVTAYVADLDAPVPSAIRRRLRDSVVPLMDPAGWSPEEETDPLAKLEDAYSQSVALGNVAWASEAQPAPAEARLIELLAKAEEECDALVDTLPAKAVMAARFMRQVAARLAKRSVGVRLGRHATQRLLEEYELTIRDQDRLDSLRSVLKGLLTGSRFRFNALASFGQPLDVEDALVTLEANPMPISPITPAPDRRPDRPAHDLPAIPVARRPIAMTFDLFLAIRLEEEGCGSGSLPASVRAALDKIKQLYAGTVCRSEDEFVERGAYLEIDRKGYIAVSTHGGRPRFMVARDRG